MIKQVASYKLQVASHLKIRMDKLRLLTLLPVVLLLLFSIATCASATEPLANLDSTIKQLANPIKIALLLGLIPLIPSALVCLTCFTRVIVVFSLLRNAIGTRTTPPNQVLVGLALFLTFFVMKPTFQRVYSDAISPYLANQISIEQALSQGSTPIRKFMLKQVRERDLALFVHFSGDNKPNNVSDIPTSTVIPAFIISELKTAFQIGFLLYLPFLIVDTVLASILLSMGMFMLPPMMISLPVKLLLFVLVDGWNLIVSSLISSFH